ncbi:MAG: 23S rRNA (adenine(2030)-N(6))-methyltransferase RlmJ, partial [Alphaproteobacteria bacterium]
VAVWHPLMAADDMAAFYGRLRAMDLPETLRLELATHAPDWQAFRPGSGMIVVNPPWGLEDEAPAMLDWLWRALSPEGAGGAVVARLADA